ncbi:unnamed protein product, partial [Cylicostephanus goldi]
MANFSRELYSNDEHDINLQKCVYLLFTPGGGKFEPSGELRKHGDTPIASRTKICLNTCSELPTKISTKVPEGERKATTTKEPTETKKPTATPKTTTEVRMPPLIKPSPPFVVFEPTDPIKSRYGLRVRILNKEYVPALSDPQTEYYQSFTKTVTDAVVSIGDVPRPIEVKSLIEETAIRGNIGELTDSYPVPQPTPFLYGNNIAKTPAGFDNAAFLTHQRHYSQATTASTKPGGNSPQSAESRDETPGGIGETTYHEWYSK